MQSSSGRMSERQGPVSPLDMIKWTLSSLAAGVAIVTTAYGVFDTRSEAIIRHHALEIEIDQASGSIEKRLERIETKLDRMRR